MGLEAEKKKFIGELAFTLPDMDTERFKALRDFYNALIEAENIAGDWWNELSQENKARIEESEKQIAEGKGISHAAIMKKYREKYSR